MNYSIVTKVAAVLVLVLVLVAVLMNGAVLGGVSYLFDSQAERAPEAAQLQRDFHAERATLGIV